MNTRRVLCLTIGLLVVVLAFVGMTTRAPVTRAATMSGGVANSTSEIRPTATYVTEAVTTLLISNEAPGRLVDYLTATGHGNETLFQVLGYLKSQSNGIISDAFYNQVAGAPAGSEAFTAKLGNYVGLNGAVEISADGTVHIRGVQASTYADTPGFGTALSQDGQFTLTYAQDTAHYIYTGSMHLQVGPVKYTYNYYAFAIAWRQAPRLYLPLIIR